MRVVVSTMPFHTASSISPPPLDTKRDGAGTYSRHAPNPALVLFAPPASELRIGNLKRSIISL